MLRQFFLGFVKIHILYHASERPVYGAELVRELARHGYNLSSGTLYPTLHRLRDQGYLRQEVRVLAGRARKYYAITEKGREALAEARQKIGELVREVLEEH